MRFAAQKTLALQDMLPADGSVYMPNMDNKMSSMMDALRAWEKKRGLSYSFKGKFIQNRPKKEPEKKVKETKPAAEKIVVPREHRKPGRPATLTKEERKRRKVENNRLYRLKHNAEARQRSKDWRAKQTPEQKEAQLERVRAWRRAKKLQRAAANAANGGGKAGLPLADCAV